MSGVTIYHNPKCGTSRNVLGLIRNAGIEPSVIEYLKTPPTRAELVALFRRMGVRARDVLREKETLCGELGLGDRRRSDEEIIDAMIAHPILINRPIVVTPKGVRLCRRSRSCWRSCPTRTLAPSAKRMVRSCAKSRSDDGGVAARKEPTRRNWSTRAQCCC